MHKHEIYSAANATSMEARFLDGIMSTWVNRLKQFPELQRDLQKVSTHLQKIASELRKCANKTE